jgi:hypothetical protein
VKATHAKKSPPSPLAEGATRSATALNLRELAHGDGRQRPSGPSSAAIGVLAVKLPWPVERRASLDALWRLLRFATPLRVTAPRADGCRPPCSLVSDDGRLAASRTKEHGWQNATSTRRSHREAAGTKWRTCAVRECTCIR